MNSIAFFYTLGLTSIVTLQDSLSDVVILCLGLDETLEGEEGDTGNACASGDKIDILFPPSQQILIEKISELNKKTVVVQFTGSAISLGDYNGNQNAIIQAFYPRAFGGKAVAELIFGEYSPCGRLPVTFYKDTKDLPEFTDYSMKNRTYKYYEGEVLYPFGFGLSYTEFEYSNAEFNNGKVSVKVKNTGKMKSREVVQLYIKTFEPEAPKYRLKGFKNIELEPQEEKEVSFEITRDILEITDENGNKVLPEGGFKAFVGHAQPNKDSKWLNVL